jgi:hypothetical protein
MRLLLPVLLLCVCGIVVLLIDRGKNEDVPCRQSVDGSVISGQTTPLDSLDLRPILRSLSSPVLEQRKATRRVLQRAGYANVLADVVRRDGPGAFLSLVRLNAQVSYSISHRPIEVSIPIEAPPDSALGAARLFPSYSKSPPFRVQLYDDWTMPEDPWR